MAQVIRTTNDLIINSLYLTGELGVGETPDAYMLSTGLELINEILGKLSADSIYLPYIKNIGFIMVPGKSTYTISDMVPADIVSDRIVDLQLANYSVQSVNYPLRIISEANFYNMVTLDNLQARPGLIFFRNDDLFSEIRLYPAPDQPYPCALRVKIMLNKLSQQDTLNELPDFYYGFLKYALGRKFISYYPSANWPAQNEQEYQDYYDILKNANPTDLTIRPSNVLDSPSPFYWTNILAY